jgi:hypothetical protein
MLLQLAAAASAVLAVAAGAAIPTPTAPQLKYQRGEIMALVHFQMTTFLGNEGCDSLSWPWAKSPATFAPTNLNTTNWVQSMVRVMRDASAAEEWAVRQRREMWCSASLYLLVVVCLTPTYISAVFAA